MSLAFLFLYQWLIYNVVDGGAYDIISHERSEYHGIDIDDIIYAILEQRRESEAIWNKQSTKGNTISKKEESSGGRRRHYSADSYH